MQKLVVYNDSRKLLVISLSYLIIAVCVVALGFTQGEGVVWPIVSVLVAACFIAGVAYNVRKAMNRSPLFVYSTEEVTDYTKPDDVISLPWSQVLNVQLKAANSNDLMLDVVGFRTKDQFEEVTPEMEAQMKANGTDRVYYLLELSGLWVRRSRIREAYDWIKKNVGPDHEGIVFGEFEDPLSKIGKKDGAKSAK